MATTGVNTRASGKSKRVLLSERPSHCPWGGQQRWVKAALPAPAFADHLRTRPAKGLGAGVRVPAGTRNFETHSTVGRDVEMAYRHIADEGGIDRRIA